MLAWQLVISGLGLRCVSFTRGNDGTADDILSKISRHRAAKVYRFHANPEGKVRTSPYYPQSNGKLERWHGSVKQECIRAACLETIEEARQKVTAYVTHDNQIRLRSAIG